MLTWKVSWWDPGSHPAGRPDGGGFVPGVDWWQAVENARRCYVIHMGDIVHAWELLTKESTPDA